MKKINRYIKTMYRPSYLVLCLGLALFSLTLLIFALNLHSDISLGESDVIFRYPRMLEQILFPLYIFIPIVFVIDLNERKKKD